jgi:hypothetical protein
MTRKRFRVDNYTTVWTPSTTLKPMLQAQPDSSLVAFFTPKRCDRDTQPPV